MSSHVSKRPRGSSLLDRANVRGVRAGRKNRKRSEAGEGARRATKLAVTIASVGAIGFGAVRLHDYAMTSSHFAIEEVVVSGHVRATAEAITRLSGAQLGQNIFSIDPTQMERMIEAHPWVKSAELTRSYPRTVEIEVVEHEPVVFVALGHLYYADEDGDIVKRYAPGEKESLPVVTGLTRDEIETDDGQARARLRSAIDFLSLAGAAGQTDIREVNLDPAMGLSFTEGEITVVVGRPPFDQAIERYGRVKQALAARKVKATRIVLGTSFERRRDRAVARLAANQWKGE